MLSAVSSTAIFSTSTVGFSEWISIRVRAVNVVRMALQKISNAMNSGFYGVMIITSFLGINDEYSSHPTTGQLQA